MRYNGGIFMKQQRNTMQRQLVLDTVMMHKDHPTADQIYLDIREINNTISRGTVYRNLNLLIDKGEIVPVKVPHADRFDYRLEKHYHLLCVSCGAVCDAPLSYSHELEQVLIPQTDYIIQGHRTIFEGICPTCQSLPCN